MWQSIQDCRWRLMAEADVAVVTHLTV